MQDCSRQGLVVILACCQGAVQIDKHAAVTHMHLQHGLPDWAGLPNQAALH